MYFYYILRFFVNILFRLIFRIKVKGLDNIPKEGKVILCSNHINLLDPIILGIIVPRQIIYMAKKELFENKILNKIINALGAFPVDREGNNLSAMRTSLRTLKDEKILGIFPEGTRVKEMDLDNVKPGVGLIAVKSKSPVIPIYIDSDYKLFHKVKVNIGKPICFDDFYNQKLSTKDYKEISKDIMESIYKLK